MEEIYNSLTDNAQREAFLDHFGNDLFTWIPQRFDEMPDGVQEDIISKSKLPEFDGFKKFIPLG